MQKNFKKKRYHRLCLPSISRKWSFFSWWSAIGRLKSLTKVVQYAIVTRLVSVEELDTVVDAPLCFASGVRGAGFEHPNFLLLLG